MRANMYERIWNVRLQCVTTTQWLSMQAQLCTLLQQRVLKNGWPIGAWAPTTWGGLRARSWSCVGDTQAKSPKRNFVMSSFLKQWNETILASVSCISITVPCSQRCTTPSLSTRKNSSWKFIAVVHAAKMYSKNDEWMCHYASDKRCADFSLNMLQKRSVAGLRLDPLGWLSALPDHLARFKR